MKTITCRRNLLIALAILLIGSFGVPNSSSAILDEGLVGFWRFDEGSGSTAYDETDNHNDGTIRGANWTNGISGYALYFHGGGQWYDGDRVLVPHSSSLDITGELTITAWIKATGVDNYLAIVDKYLCDGVSNYGFTLLVSAGKLRFSIYSGSNWGDLFGTSELRDDTWHHVAGVWDGSYIRVYVDGQQEGEAAWAFPPASTTNDLGIGERVYGWGGYMPFLGKIDEVRIYNRALSNAEIWGRAIDRTVDLTPYFDWGAISSFAGLAPPGNMGIWSPPHSSKFYFPSDSLAPFTFYPKAWLTSGIHLATNYGPANVRIGACPTGFSTVIVPDRNSKPCSLLVDIPPANLIDQATDLNVVQISSGETKTISINEAVETMVFLANCDGWAEDLSGPSPDQPLEVRLSYNDGTADTAVFDNIHPAGRLDIIDPGFPPSWIFIYGNEVFVCDPAYFDLPSPSCDPYHSEAWHWYALHPNNTKLLNSITFVGIQSGDYSEIYILALSHNGVFICGDVNADGVIDIGDVVYLINYLYKNGPAPIPTEAGDVNEDDVIDIGDVVHLINYLYKNGPAPCEEKGGTSGKVSTLTDDVGQAQLWLSLATAQNSAEFSKISPGCSDGVYEISVGGKFDRDVAGVQLEIEFDPDEVTMLDPALTAMTNELQLFSNTKNGTQKIGIVDLTGESLIPAGEGALVYLRAKGEDVSSIRIKNAVVVDQNALPLALQLSGELKQKETNSSSSKPQHFTLFQNHPNPFNPQTSIRYALPQDAQVKLIIYNLLGQKVKTLVDENQPAGYNEVFWDAKDEKGNQVSSGVYFYRLEAGKFSDAKKMLLMK